MDKLTAEQSRLLFMIAQYSKPSQSEGEKALWIRQTSLRALMFEGIRKKVFDWDYAPASVMTADGRRFMNISQEGEDDLNDLREMGLITSLKLSTSRRHFITAYCVTEKGLGDIGRLPAADKDAIDGLIKCGACSAKRLAQWRDEKVMFTCERCGKSEESEIMDIEDVSYIAKAYIPKIPILRKHHGGA